MDRLADIALADIAEVSEFWRGLGLPGLIDLHVHFMPQNVLSKVWAFFDAGHKVGRAWPVAYKLPEDERVELLRAFGVRRFGALSYPHKPDMAEWLNSWGAEFASRTPDALHCATFYPEEGAGAYVGRALDDGARLFKAHLQVGRYDPRSSLLEPVWGLLAETGTPVVVHCGSGPTPGEFTGIGPISEVMERHPDLVMIVAHMGAPEYGDFLDLAARHPFVHLDTTIVFSDLMDKIAPFPPSLMPRLLELGDRIVLGTDFPNIPHRYGHQLESLARLELGDDWLRGVCWHNPARLLG
ncbi:MAG TPA: amidohydrolase family protein [Streptosporangiaceae bacterium]|nr:amidohydrolase family protein [Streptosporangiaceae bacterium]